MKPLYYIAATIGLFFSLNFNLSAQELRPVEDNQPGMAEGVRRFAEDFRLTGGLRYWYATSNSHFSFSNGLPGYGSPTSTLDWNGNTAHSGEGFLRLDHLPTRIFIKTLGGGGGINGDGDMVDRDFAAGQRSFSATRSTIDGSGLSYAMVDIGMHFTPAPERMPELKIGPLIGYHYWYDNPIARGGRCEPVDLGPRDCSGLDQIDQVTKVIGYGIRWHALRVGLEATTPIAAVRGLSVSAEVAWVPYARFDIDDSHYLRRDLGPTPNGYQRGSARGVEAEAFLRYAVTDRFRLGIGGRYWGLFSYEGESVFRQAQRTFPGTRFDQQRYGLLLEAKYRF